MVAGQCQQDLSSRGGANHISNQERVSLGRKGADEDQSDSRSTSDFKLSINDELGLDSVGATGGEQSPAAGPEYAPIILSERKRRRLQAQVQQVVDAYVSDSRASLPALLLVSDSILPSLHKCPCWQVKKNVCEKIPAWNDAMWQEKSSCICVLAEAQVCKRVIEMLRKNVVGIPWFVISRPKQGVSEVTGSSQRQAGLLKRALTSIANLLHALNIAVSCEQRVRKMEEGHRSATIACRECSTVMTDPSDLAAEEMSLWTSISPSMATDQLTRSLPRLLPLNPARATVYNKEDGQVRGVHFGLLVRRGRGVSSADHQYPEALQALHLLAKCRPLNHVYMAIQVNMLLPPHGIQEHLDARNQGDTWVLSFGNYRGGKLKVKMPDGSWKYRDNYQRWVQLSQGTPHQVEAVTEGVRYSVVLYVPLGFEAALATATDKGSVADQLRQLGYPVPCQNSEVFVVDTTQMSESDQSCIAGNAVVFLQPGGVIPRTTVGRWKQQVIVDLNHNQLPKQKHAHTLFIVPSQRSQDLEEVIRWFRMQQCHEVFCEETAWPEVQKRMMSEGRSLSWISKQIVIFQESVVPLIRRVSLHAGCSVMPVSSSLVELGSKALYDCYPSIHQEVEREQSGESAPFPASTEGELLRLIRRAHEKMGHPHPEQFCRVLRQAHASDRVLSMAKNLKCSICQMNKPPQPPRISAVSPCIEFNVIVGLDVFHLQGIHSGEQIHVLSMIDWGTLFHVCVMIKEVTARRVRRAYRRYWLRVFGSGKMGRRNDTVA